MSDKGEILGQDDAGTNDPRAAKRRRDDALASPTTPVAKDADQAEYVASACSLGASHTHSSRSIRIRVGTTLVARSCAWSDRNSILFEAQQLSKHTRRSDDIHLRLKGIRDEQQTALRHATTKKILLTAHQHSG